MAETLFVQAAELDALLTTWRAQGPTLDFNAMAGKGPQEVVPNLYQALRISRVWSEKTGGAFDPTILPLTNLWRRAAARGEGPTTLAISAARDNTGYRGLTILTGGRAALARGGMGVEFGGIGKGWALDKMAERIPRSPEISFLFDFGGSSYLARGAPPGRNDWRVEIRAASGAVVGVFPLSDEALSISGSLGRVKNIGGRDISHIIDPRTGVPVRGDRMAFTRSTDATSAEAISTALIVLERSEAQALLAEISLEARVIEADATDWATAGWR